MEILLMLIGLFFPVLLIGAIVLVVWVLYRINRASMTPENRAMMDRIAASHEAHIKAQLDSSPTKRFKLTEDGVPDRLGGVLCILDNFEVAAGSFGTKWSISADHLPASPDIVENTLTKLLADLKDPKFRNHIKRYCHHHQHILEDGYAELLRFNVVHNLPRMIKTEEAEFMNTVLPPCITDGRSHTPEEVKEHMVKHGISFDEIEKANEMNRAQLLRSMEIDKRLQSKGL
jgi:hypothetical protein